MNNLFSVYFNSEYEGTVKINKTEFVGKKITITNSNKVVGEAPAHCGINCVFVS